MNIKESISTDSITPLNQVMNKKKVILKDKLEIVGNNIFTKIKDIETKNYDSISHLKIEGTKPQESRINFIKQVLKIAKNDKNKIAISQYSTDIKGYSTALIYDYTNKQNIDVFKFMDRNIFVEFVDLDKSEIKNKLTTLKKETYWLNNCCNTPYYFKQPSKDFNLFPYICIENIPLFLFKNSGGVYFTDETLEIYMIGLPDGAVALCTLEKNGTWEIHMLGKEPQQLQYNPYCEMKKNEDGTWTNYQIKQAYLTIWKKKLDLEMK